MTEEKRVKRKATKSKNEQILAKRLFGAVTSDSDSEDDPVLPQTTTANVATSLWRDEDDEAGEVAMSNYNPLLSKSYDTEETVVSREEYSKRLRTAFVRTKGKGATPKWAANKKKERTKDSDSDSDVDDIIGNMSRNAMKYVEKDVRLSRGTLTAKVIKSYKADKQDKKPMNVIRFFGKEHLLVAGNESGSLTFLKVHDEDKVDYLQQVVRFQKFPVTALEIVHGNTVVAGSRSKPYLMKLDVQSESSMQIRPPREVYSQNMGLFCVSPDSTYIAVANRTGQVHIFSFGSMECVGTCAASSPVVSLSFSPLFSSTELWAITEKGEIFHWDIRGKGNSFMDDGAVVGTNITISGNGQRIATGSSTGIVNVYSTGSSSPLRVCSSLRTGCSSIALSHDGDVVVMGSDAMKNQLRACHVSSGVTFSDFPARFENIPDVHSIRFSPHSGFLSVGCANGFIRLYRIHHYDSY